MNPMIRKELQQRMRERKAWLLPSLCLMILAGVVALTYNVTIDPGYDRSVQGAELGIVIFVTLAISQMVLLLLLGPVFSAGAITIEKEQRTLPALLTSLLHPAEIWWGKFTASVLFMILLLIIGLPVLALSFALGGIGAQELLMVGLTSVIIVATVSCIGLFASSYFRRSVHATAVTYASVIALTVLTFVGFSITMMVGRYDGEWSQLPVRARAWLYFNPLFFLGTSVVPTKYLYPEWVRPLCAFLGVAALSTALAIRNLGRSGDQV